MLDRTELEKEIGYTFKDSELLTRALTHRSFGGNNNERLEYLGDSILGFIIAEALYVQFPQSHEGDLTRMRAKLVRQQTLASVARLLNLHQHVLLGSGELKSGGYDRDSILSDTLEAIIGATYLDAGFEQARSMIHHLFKNLLNQISPQNIKDSKTRLQELLQKLNRPLPIYNMIKQEGDAHNLQFTIECVIPHQSDVKSFHGKGHSKRIAEQNAAKLALSDFNE